MIVLERETRSREELADITADVAAAIRASGIADGHCLVFIPHTTAGITINECADPDVRRDILAALRRIVPDNLPYAHAEGNSPAHVKASLLGSSATVIVEGGRLVLGTWQGLFLAEFDGPRRRKINVEVRPR